MTETSFSRRDFLKTAVLIGGSAMLPTLSHARNIQSQLPANEEIYPLLKGVCDLHIHAAPDSKARSVDELTFCQQAKKLGYRAVLFKSNEWSNHDRAFLIRQVVPDFSCFGALVMNPCFGGRVNPQAVAAALKTTGNYCKCVWMPTLAASYALKQIGQENRAIPVVEGSMVLPEVVRVMELCAEADIMFATGHSSAEENLLMAQKAREVGVKKFVITHANAHIWKMSVDQIKQAADYGAYIEYTCLPLFWGKPEFLPERPRQTIQEFADFLNIVPERSFISTDLGQPELPAPAEGLSLCLQGLAAQGVSLQKLKLWTQTNPLRLLNLEKGE